MPWHTIQPGETYLVPGRRKMKAIEPDPNRPSVWWVIDKEQRWHAFDAAQLKPLKKVRTRKTRRSNGSEPRSDTNQL